MRPDRVCAWGPASWYPMLLASRIALHICNGNAGFVCPRRFHPGGLRAEGYGRLLVDRRLRAVLPYCPGDSGDPGPGLLAGVESRLETPLAGVPCYRLHAALDLPLLVRRLGRRGSSCPLCWSLP